MMKGKYFGPESPWRGVWSNPVRNSDIKRHVEFYGGTEKEVKKDLHFRGYHIR